MIGFVRGLSPRGEFFVVVTVAFGAIILGNVFSVFYPLPTPAINNAELRFMLVYELVLMTFLGTLLHLRGWKFPRLGAPFTPQDLVIAPALVLGTYLVAFFLGVVLDALGGDILSRALAKPLAAQDISVASLIAVSIVNPIFEEVLLCGYIVTAVKERRSFWTAVNVSVAIRLACHLYQGVMALIFIVPLGLLFTIWFARTRRLWPVVLAHAIVDALGLWFYLAP
jgi:uncharacterized protein